MSTEENKPIQGKPWTNTKIFVLYKEADILKNTLIKEWENEKKEGMQVKIKLSSKGFIVKTRLHPDFEPKKTKKTKKRKKSGKNSRSDTKNTDSGKNQPS